MTTSELMTVMTSGMAHISGGVMAAYIAFGIDPAHLLTAVIMTAPGHADDGEDFRAGDGSARHAGHRPPRGGEHRRQRHRRGGPRHRVRGCSWRSTSAPMLISFVALHRAAQRHPRHGRLQPAADLRLGVLADGVEPGRAVERRGGGGEPARHAHGAQRVHRVRAARRAEGLAGSAHRSPSRRSRCAASPTSAPSAFRSAVSARWRRRAVWIWRAWACERCWPARWRTFVTAIIVGFSAVEVPDWSPESSPGAAPPGPGPGARRHRVTREPVS